jgi:hypothetical protein
MREFKAGYSSYQPASMYCGLVGIGSAGKSNEVGAETSVRDCAGQIPAHWRQDSLRKFFRRGPGLPAPRQASTAAWVLAHTGTARASNFPPFGVNSSRRTRWSRRSVVILIRRRRCSGFRAAVKVVRSITSNDATAPIVGASGRFKDIISENCPLVIPSGRSALSKRRASARAARCT